MRVLVVALHKGGVAKTTTAVNLAAGLAQAGHRTLLVDADAQAHATEMFIPDEDTIGGVVLSELGRNPAVGDCVPLGPVMIEVLEVQLNRVATVRITVHQPETVPREEE